MEKISKIITYAKNNVKFYNELFNNLDTNEFEKIPLLNKVTIRPRIDDFISSEYKKKNLIVEYTSGSTGKPLEIYKDNLERNKSNILLWKSRHKYIKNIMSLTMVKFYAITEINGKLIYDPIFHRGNEINVSLFDLSDEALEQHWKYILKQGDIWIFAPPSAVYRLAKFLQNNPTYTRDNVKFIEATGEVFFQEQRKVIEEVFECPIANHYGNREFWGIAYECKNGYLHIYDDYVYVEIIGNDGEKLEQGELGEIVLTGLHKYAMPLIRYKTGDYGRLLSSDCECGNKANILEIKGGRTTDYIITEKGDTINSILVYFIIFKINMNGTFIEQFQMIQNSLTNFIVNLSITNNAEIELIEKIFYTEMNKYVSKDVCIKFNYIDKINQDNTTGKFKYFYSMIEKER